MKSKTLNDSRIWVGSTVALIVVLIVLLATGSCTGGLISQEIGKDKVASNTLDFINTKLLRGEANAELKSIEDWNGLYKITINLANKNFEVYVTKNGEFLFPQVIDMYYIPEQQAPAKIPKSKNPTAMLFTMSFCPYGNQAEDNIAPVANALKNVIEIVPHYIISKTSNQNGTIDEMYASLHGSQELHQNIRELCVYKYEKEKYWDFVLNINKNCSYSNADACWEPIAQTLGLNISKIKECYENEAKTLIENEIALSEQYSVSASPTLLINDVEYSGQRTPQAYKDAICSAFENMPEECNAEISSTNTEATASGSC